MIALAEATTILKSIAGRFRFQGLKPGSYMLAVGAGIEERTVERIRGISAGPGVVRDARLDPLDLRGRYRVIRLNVLDEDGRTVNAFVIAKYPSGRSQVGWTRWPGILTAKEREEYLLVEADGFLPVALEPFDGPRKLVLKRGLPVTLRYAGEAPLPESPLSLVVTLESAFTPVLPPGQLPLPERWSIRKAPYRGTFDAEGRLELHVSEPGVYSLRWSVDLEDGVATREIRPTPAPAVSVNGKADPPHEVAVDAALLEQALSELRALQGSSSTSSDSDNE